MRAIFSFRAMCWWGLLAAAWIGSPACAAERWLTGRSEHFTMLSTESEKESRRILANLERFRSNVLAIFPSRAVHEPRVTVVLFGSDRTFTPYKPRYQGKPKEVTGFFCNNPDEVFIAMCTDYDSDEDGDPQEIIFHEYLHLLVHSRGLRLPLWLDEGLAEVFSTFEVDGKHAVYGRTKQSHIDFLSFSALMPLERLIATDVASPDYNEEDRATVFYAQSWLLTHFLLCGEKRANADKLMRLFTQLDSTTDSPEAAFREIFGSDFDGMEWDLRSYLSGGRFFERRMALRQIDEKKITFRPATAVEREVGQLNLRWRVHRSVEEVPAMIALAEREPAAPGPQELLAAVAMTQGDSIAAANRWRRAAELGSQNPFVYVQVARDAVKGFALGEFEERLAPEVAANLQQGLDRALALRPGYSEALEALALVEARAPRLRAEGINVVQAGVAHMRDRDVTLLCLAMIRWRANDRPTCLEILDALLTKVRATPQVRAAARSLRLLVAPAGAASAPGVTPAAK